MASMNVSLTSTDAKAREQCKHAITRLLAAVERRLWREDFDALPRFDVPLKGRGFTAWESDGSKDINDLRQRMLERLPRRMHLEMSGNAEGECYAPFFCVHVHLGIPFKEFVELIGDDFGWRLAWGRPGSTEFIHRDRRGLRRHHNSLDSASWIWVDTTLAIPYLTAGILM
jgi:hypothetical protein